MACDSRSFRVAVTGGTHGNEYTGVWCVKKFRANPELVKRPNLDVVSVLNNLKAIDMNKRFVDSDLNRAFSRAALEDHEHGGYEHNRAQTLNNLLGPKGSAQPKTDFIMDLHTSTANVGLTFCLTPSDSLAMRCATYVKQKMPDAPVYLLVEGATEGATAVADMTGAGALMTIARHGLEVEVGPVAQGLLRDETLQLMEAAIHHCLDYLSRYAAGAPPAVPLHTQVYCDEGKIPWELDAAGFPTSCTHRALQDRDYKPLKRGDPVLRHIDGREKFYEGEDGLVPVFVNEAGYYNKASGLGIGLARIMTINTETMERKRLTPASKL